MLWLYQILLIQNYSLYHNRKWWTQTFDKTLNHSISFHIVKKKSHLFVACCYYWDQILISGKLKLITVEGLYLASRKKSPFTFLDRKMEFGQYWLKYNYIATGQQEDKGRWIHLAWYIALSILLCPKFPSMYISYFLCLQLRKDSAAGWLKQLVPFHTSWQLPNDTEK